MEEPNRTLTKAEQKRFDAFKEKAEKLESEGYKRKDLLVSIITANTVGTLVAAIPCVIGVFAFYAVNRGFTYQSTPLVTAIYFVIAMILIVVHELTHGFFWSLGAQNGFKDIEFGFIVKYLTPYCTCASPLKKHMYLIGTFMPMFLLGICPMIVAIITGNMPLFVLGIFHTLAGAGDILIILKLLMYRSKGKDVYFFDHPYDCGLIAFEK